MKSFAVARWCVRVLVLVGALFFALGGPLLPSIKQVLPGWEGRILPVLSPLVALSEAIAQRSWYLGIFWLAPPLAIFLLATWRGRWFCRWICPTGTCYSVAAKISPRKTRLRLLKWRISPTIFYAILFSSILGVTQFLSLDPLSSFTRLTSRAASLAAWVPGAVVPAFLISGPVSADALVQSCLSAGIHF